jgi:hypothetical protein
LTKAAIFSDCEELENVLSWTALYALAISSRVCKSGGFTALNLMLEITPVGCSGKSMAPCPKAATYTPE